RAREFDNVSFSVRQGETLGIYGLVGAGRTELAQCLFGLTAPDAGSIHIGGKPVTIGSPADAVRHGLAYVPEDRQQQGAILPFSIASNLALTNLSTLAPRGICSRQRESELANHWISALGIKATGPEQNVGD